MSKLVSYIFKNCECLEKSHMMLRFYLIILQFNVRCYKGISFHFLMVVNGYILCACAVTLVDQRSLKL